MTQHFNKKLIDVHNINFTQLSKQSLQLPIISLLTITSDECKKKIWHFISIRNWTIGITSILRSYQTGHPANQLSVIFTAMCKVGNKLSTGKTVSSTECSLQIATNGFNIFWMNIQILMYNLFFWIIFLCFLTIATHLSTRATNIWQDHPVDRIFFKICQQRIKVKYCRLVNMSRKEWFYTGQ